MYHKVYIYEFQCSVTYISDYSYFSFCFVGTGFRSMPEAKCVRSADRFRMRQLHPAMLGQVGANPDHRRFL